MAWRKKNFRENRAFQDIPKVLEQPPDYPVCDNFSDDLIIFLLFV